MSGDRRRGERRRPFFRSGVRRPEAEDAVELELRHHLAETVDRLVEEGLSREEAEAEARRAFGDVERVRQELVAMEREREGRMRIGERVSRLAQDVRHALRGLRRNPGFATGVVLTLGVGLGAVAVIFTVLDALLLRPLPFHEPDRLVRMGLEREGSGFWQWVMEEQAGVWDRQDELFASVAQHAGLSLVRTDGAEPRSVRGVAVSHDLDETLGVQPRIGRACGADDARPGVPATAVLTHRYWERLGGVPDVLGTTLQLDGTPFTVVGVLPPDFKYPFPSRHDLWVCMSTDHQVNGRRFRRLQLLARLRDGVSLPSARERANVLASRLEEERPNRWGWRVRIDPLGSWRANAEVSRALWMLFGAVGLFLALAVSNGASLLVVRGSVRARELAVRRALGASRLRVVGQLAVEGWVLGLLAGGVAVGLAVGGVALVRGLLPGELAWSSVYDFEVNARILGFLSGSSALLGVALGVLPGLRLVRDTGTSTLGTGRGSLSTPGSQHLRRGLVVIQVALAASLLLGAGLFVNSFVRLASVDPGFEAENLVLMALSIQADDRRDFARRLERRLERLPGVEAASVANGLPPDAGFSFDVRLETDGGEVPDEQPPLLPFATVRGDFLDVLGVRLLDGRGFGPEDEVESGNVIVDEGLAELLWGTASPVGRRFRVGPDEAWLTVVGVVEDLGFLGLDDREAPHGYLRPFPSDFFPGFISVAIRTTRGPDDMLIPIRRAVYELDPGQPVHQIRTAGQALAESIAEPRFLVTVVSMLAGVAAFIAVVGIYGLLSYTVTRRRREMGVRIALGAGAGRVRRLVLREGLVLATVGVTAGLAVAWGASRVLGSFLYGVEPTDHATFATVAVLALTVSAAASYVPARRATSVNPADVLREE